MRHRPNGPHRLIPASELEDLAEIDPKARRRKLKQIEIQLQDDAGRISFTIVAGMSRLIEAVLFFATAAFVYVLYVADYTPEVFTAYFSIALTATLCLTFILKASQLYAIEAFLRVARILPKLSLALITVFAAIFAFVFFSKIGDSYSRVWLGSWMVASFGLLTLCRFVTAKAVWRWNADGRLNRRAVLVGGGAAAAQLIAALEASPGSDVSIVGIFDDRGDDRSPCVVAGYPKLGTTGQLEDFARKVAVDLLIFTLPLHAEDRLLDLAKKLWILPVDIRLSAYPQKLRYRPRAYSYIGNIPFLDVFDRPLADRDQLVKTIEDKVIASLALLAAAPVMLLVAVAIKLESRGPVLFRQKSYGFNNELVEIYKFRSMYVNCCDSDATRLVSKDDSRVTAIGRIIRKTSLDELPQLLNVLKGELSLVGPRPHATQAKAANSPYNEAVESYFARHRVKPGITGWAQVNGWRGETDTLEKIQRRVECDLYYIENWSLFLDLHILLRTPYALVNTDKAY